MLPKQAFLVAAKASLSEGMMRTESVALEGLEV